MGKHPRRRTRGVALLVDEGEHGRAEVGAGGRQLSQRLLDELVGPIRVLADNGHNICCPQITDPQLPTHPLLGIGAGYVQRAIDQVPRRGDDGPWQVTMNYNYDAKVLRDGPVDDENLRFSTASPATKRELVLTA